MRLQVSADQENRSGMLCESHWEGATQGFENLEDASLGRRSCSADGLLDTTCVGR